jgi:hypothetical protein
MATTVFKMGRWIWTALARRNLPAARGTTAVVGLAIGTMYALLVEEDKLVVGVGPGWAKERSGSFTALLLPVRCGALLPP